MSEIKLTIKIDATGKPTIDASGGDCPQRTMAIAPIAAALSGAGGFVVTEGDGCHIIEESAQEETISL